MGNVQVKYKAMRGSHEEGDPVEEAKDWFENTLISQRDEFMAMYNGLPEDKQQQLKDCFDGNDVFRNVGSANGWLGEADDEDLQECQAKVMKLL